MLFRTRAVAAVAAVLAAAAIPLGASTPQFFQAASQNDFLRGDLENLAIDARGQLLLGPATELLYEAPAPFLWALVPGPDGALYAGTGNEGRVYRVAPDGTARVFFDAAELEAHALAFAPDGALYVGTSPDGKIYRVERNGTSRVFFEPGEKYIWALATDGKGVVYAATGEHGVVFRITPDGKGTRFYQATATHATALALDPRGAVLVGTESPARVLRVDAGGRAFLLLDSPFQEIRALRFDERGVLYAAAVSGPSDAHRAPSVSEPSPERSTSDGSAPVPSVSVEVTSVSVVDGSGGSAGVTTTRDDSRAARGAIYRIAADGLWDQVWESREDAPYDLVFDADDRLVVGTGPKGKIFRFEGVPLRPTLLTRAPAQQVMGFHRDRQGRLHFATANPGKVFRLSSDLAPRGTYESEPRDAEIVSSWGAISWRGTTPDGAAVEVYTRSGNTATPDDTWSPWSVAYTVATGSPIVSPKARYLQWRIVLTRPTAPGRQGAASPVLTSVSAAYLQRNLAPTVRSVTVHPPGIVFQKPFSTGDPELAGFDDQTTIERRLTSEAMNAQQGSSGSPQLGRRSYEKGLQTVVWRADDENDDDLTYELRYRREGEPEWRVLRSDITEPIIVFDTTTMPNGTYFLRVVAADSAANPPADALTGEMDSAPFDIDNVPPRISVQGARREGNETVVAFEVADDHAPIERAEYSLDGVRWQPVFPVDGMADTRTERYEVTIREAVSSRGITLRASDTMHNLAAGHADAPPDAR